MRQVFYHRQCKTVDLGDVSDFQAWKRLKAKYEPVTNAAKCNLLQEYQNTKMKSGQDPDIYITKL